MTPLRSIALLAVLGLTACGHSQPSRPRSPDPLASAPASLLLKRGRAYAAAGDTIRAEQYLVAASHRGARDRDVVPALLQACIRGQRFRAALAHAEHFLARRPRDRALRQLTASLYLATGQPEQARDQLEAVVEDDPDAPEPRYLLAMTHQQLGDAESAAAELRAFLELQPTGALAREAREWLADAGDAGDGERRRSRRHKRRHR